MSFSRARIHRFNEAKADCTPSPAKYNVSMRRKIKLGIFNNAERFTSKKSPTASDMESFKSTPCFQTPTVPKKKKFLGFSSASKPPKHRDLEELREKLVECSNKDAYIRELVDQIEELKENSSKLKNENLELLQLEQKRLEELDSLKTSVTDLQRLKNSLQDEYNELKVENLVNISKVLACINKFEDLYSKTVQDNCAKEKELVASLKEAEARLGDSEDKIKSMEDTWRNKLVDAEDSWRVKLEESDAKVKLLQENFSELDILNKMQIEARVAEVEATWSSKLEAQLQQSEAILKECQEISEYNIIQSEIEKNQIRNQLKAKEIAYENLKHDYDQLQPTHQPTYKNLQQTLAALKEEKRIYEITIKTNSETIEVLKKRLRDSDRDVIQLKEELSRSEDKILSLEAKVNDLTQSLHEAQTAQEEMEMQFESTSKTMQSQAENLEKHLTAKVEALQQILPETQRQLAEAMQQLQVQKALSEEAQDVISKSELLISQLERDNLQLETRSVELELDLMEASAKLEDEMQEGSSIRRKYIETSGKYDELSQQFEPLLQELDQVKLENCQLKMVTEELDRVKMENCQLKMATEELDRVKLENFQLKMVTEELDRVKMENCQPKMVTEDRDVGVLCHHKHNSELFQKSIDMESENFKLCKLVEKLRRENEELRKLKKSGKQYAGDKENLGSPARNLNGSSRIESPGPLKEKNN